MEQYLARGGLVETIDDSEQSALAAARGSDDAYELLVDVEGQMVENNSVCMRFSWVCLDDVFDLEKDFTCLAQGLHFKLVSFCFPKESSPDEPVNEKYGGGHHQESCEYFHVR